MTTNIRAGVDKTTLLRHCLEQAQRLREQILQRFSSGAR
jgi:hypothetical protein